MIRKATDRDLPALISLSLSLWPDHTPEELREEYAPLLSSRDAAFFLLCSGEEAIGFAQCQLRHDYVEGTSGGTVGYLEGIYIRPSHRGQGHGRALLAQCETWVRGQGCREFASDCELDNLGSLAFHQKAGFQEANRIICFVKRL